MLDHGSSEKCLKTGRKQITPIFKKTKKEYPENYKPIPGNVIEQLILETISRNMKDKEIISSSQHGFIKRESCLTTLIRILNKWPDGWAYCKTSFKEVLNKWKHSVSKGWWKANACKVSTRAQIIIDSFYILCAVIKGYGQILLKPSHFCCPWNVQLVPQSGVSCFTTSYKHGYSIQKEIVICIC